MGSVRRVSSKPGWANGALSVVAAALALLAAEGLARLAGVEPRLGQLIFVRAPATRTVSGVPLWDHAQPRCEEADIERVARAPDAFTIVGLGDSIMYGVRLPREATYLDRARHELTARSGRHVEVLNLAVPGYNAMQENIVYRQLDERVRADLVLVHHWVDDAHQYHVVGSHVVDLGNISEDEGKMVLRAIPLPPLLGDFLLVHSRLYDLLTQAIVGLRRRDAGDNWERMAAALLEIADRARASGARAAVLSSASFDADRPLPNSDVVRLRDLLVPRGVDVIDLAEWLQGHRSADVGMDMCHLSAAGHRIVAERLVDYVMQRDLRAAGIAPHDRAVDR